jgi:hypothetical protein
MQEHTLTETKPSTVVWENLEEFVRQQIQAVLQEITCSTKYPRSSKGQHRCGCGRSCMPKQGRKQWSSRGSLPSRLRSTAAGRPRNRWERSGSGC